MRDINEVSATAWLVVYMSFIFIPYIYISCGNLNSMQTFDLEDWLLLFGLSISGIYGTICRTKATHYEEPARLTVLNYFASVIQLLMDMIFLQTDFTVLQIFGVAVVLGANSVKWAAGVVKILSNRHLKK